MQVVVKKHVLDQMIRTLAEERSYHSRKNNQIAGDDRPVLPDAQMAMQLSTEQIPVGNPDFLPVNKKQAAAAAAQMTAQVDPDKLQKYFAGLKKLIRKTATVEKYKGMSETDLFEALRPMVLAEAEENGKSIDAVISGFKSKLGTTVWRFQQKTFQDLVNNFSNDPTRLKGEYPGWEKADFQTVLDAMKDPNWKAAAQPRQPRKPKEAEDSEESVESPTVKLGKKPSRLSVAAAEIDALAAEKVAAKIAKKSSAAGDDKLNPDEQRDKDTIDNNRHISLDDVIKRDIGRIVDVIKNAGLPMPKSFASSGIQIKVTPSNVVKGYFKGATIRTIAFLPGPKTPYKDLSFKNIRHTGGAIPIWKDDDTPDFYYTTTPFPFDENEYKSRFAALFLAAAGEFAKSEMYASEKSARKTEDEEIAALEKIQKEKEKSQRSATMQKSLSLDLAIRDAVAMREENPKKLEKLLAKLSPAITLAAYDTKSIAEKDAINSQIVTLLDKERGPYYDVGDMDYLRDIFDEDADTRYSKAGEGVSSNDPVAVGVELLYESFFNTCFEPVMSYVIETMIDNNPDKDIDFSEVIGAYGLGSYEEFKDVVDDKDAWIELVLKVTKDILLKDPDSFDNVMPSFGKIRNAVESKGDLSEFEGRLKMLGIEDVGRLRSIFQYLKSPVAFMKAIKTTVQLQSLEGKSSTASRVSSPEKLRSEVAEHIKKLMSNDPVSLFATNKRSLMSIGIMSALDLSNANASTVVAAIGPDMEKRLSKALATAPSPANSEAVQDEVLQAIEDFVLILDTDFSAMSEVTNPASKPVLEYAKTFVNDIAVNSGDPEFTAASAAIVLTIDGILKPKKVAKK
jgi:hypothetical protein